MSRQAVSTDKAPKAIGPYSQGLRAGNLLFVSGQIPLDPANGAVVGATIEEQTERVLRNVAGVVEAAGLTLGHVARTTVFLKDIGEFPRMNEVYALFFGDHRPARSTVEVSNLPKGVKIEIDAIAVAG
jgi:2-iminobutanoate/2-iminopropanoate deaminase